MQFLQNRRVRFLLTLLLLAGLGLTVYQLLTGPPRHQYHRAEKALLICDFKEAGLRLEKYLEYRPHDAEAHLLTAQTARRRGDFHSADHHLTLALEHGAKPDLVSAEYTLLRVQSGNLADATLLAKYCEENPATQETALALEALIEGSLRTYELPLAGWSVKKWLAYRTGKLDQARGFIWRGRLKEWTGDYPGALSDFREAAQLAPVYVPARLRIAYAVLREDPHQAKPEVDWLLNQAPDDSDVRLLAARWRRALGQPEEAGKLLDELLAPNPDQFLVLLERGRIALDLNRPVDAEAWLRRALKLEPDERNVNLAMSDCLRLAGRPDAAREFQDKALKINTPLESMPRELK